MLMVICPCGAMPDGKPFIEYTQQFEWKSLRCAKHSGWEHVEPPGKTKDRLAAILRGYDLIIADLLRERDAAIAELMHGPFSS